MRLKYAGIHDPISVDYLPNEYVQLQKVHISAPGEVTLSCGYYSHYTPLSAVGEVLCDILNIYLREWRICYLDTVPSLPSEVSMELKTAIVQGLQASEVTFAEAINTLCVLIDQEIEVQRNSIDRKQFGIFHFPSL